MRLKKRLFLNRAITIILGIFIIGIGIIKDIATFLTMGTAMIICALLQLVKQRGTLSDTDKMKELENVYKDERVIFIAQKSYSFAFWLSVYAEFIGILVSMYLGMENIYYALSLVVCFQMLAYVTANIFYGKRY